MRRTMVLVLLLSTMITRAPGEEPAPSHWKDAAAGYRIEVEASRPRPLTLCEEPALKWSNPQRRADDGAVFLWLDRGRPEAAASFYKYKSGDKPFEDHEFISLSASPMTSKLSGEVVWTPTASIKFEPIPGAPAPAATAAERLRQMKALAREFRASYNNPPDLSEIRPLTQPIYRYETEGKRADVTDGALFAYVHTTDPEVLLMIEAHPGASGAAATWQYALARMSLVNMRVEHKGREVWSASWDSDLKKPMKPYFVRSLPSTP